MTLRHRERITVERDGEELEVWNFVNVTMAHQIRGTGTLETFYGSSAIERGGGHGEPDYVTTWIAEELQHEHGIDLPDDNFDIEVIDVESDDVTVI
jgi:hypothetical protein